MVPLIPTVGTPEKDMTLLEFLTEFGIGFDTQSDNIEYEVVAEWYGEEQLVVVGLRFDHQEKRIIIEVEDAT